MNSSPSMVLDTSRQLPGLLTRSPFAMVTLKLPHGVSWRPAWAAASMSMKLSIESESRRDVSATVLMITLTFIVRLEHDAIPASAWMDIVGLEPSSVADDSLLWMSSMVNNCLHTNLCPSVNSSSEWKQCPSLRCSVISAAVKRLTKFLATIVGCVRAVMGVDCVPSYGVILAPTRLVTRVVSWGSAPCDARRCS
jgi:hypothetical protein